MVTALGGDIFSLWSYKWLMQPDDCKAVVRFVNLVISLQIELGDTKSCNQIRDEVSIGCLSKTTKQLASSFSLQYHP